MPYDDETHKNLAMSYRDMGGTDKPLEAAKEMVSVLEWIRAHPSMHLNTGHLLTVRCPQCGHTCVACDALAIDGVPCTVCETRMDILRWRVAERVRKNPYSYGRSGRMPSVPPGGYIETYGRTSVEPRMECNPSVTGAVSGNRVGTYLYVSNSDF